MQIFVAKLSPKTTKNELKDLFAQFGEVTSCKVIMDHETGLSKCYGFVEMPNENEAYKAIVETDETVFMGSELQVKKSRPQATPTKPVKRDKPRHFAPRQQNHTETEHKESESIETESSNPI
jgi:RNA recognition motif-containing protein